MNYRSSGVSVLLLLNFGVSNRMKSLTCVMCLHGTLSDVPSNGVSSVQADIYLYSMAVKLFDYQTYFLVAALAAALAFTASALTFCASLL
jgi:hypothetical protein